VILNVHAHQILQVIFIYLDVETALSFGQHYSDILFLSRRS